MQKKSNLLIKNFEKNYFSIIIRSYAIYVPVAHRAVAAGSISLRPFDLSECYHIQTKSLVNT